MNEMIREYELVSDSGMKLKFLNYAGAVTSLKVLKSNTEHEVIVGPGKPENFLLDKSSFGALVGRFANRIKDGQFRLDGNDYQLEKNHKGNHLHGGSKGLHKSYMDVEILSSSHARLSHVLADSESGYKGNVQVQVDYKLKGNDWVINYEAETDHPVPVNFTSHCYFNLGGLLTDHEITIHTEEYLPIDDRSIPMKNAPSSVQGTPFDFRKPTRIGDTLFSKDDQIIIADGFDHCFARRTPLSQPEPIAEAALNGLRMEVLTTEPGVQFFTANFDEPQAFPDGTVIEKHSAFCLETQHFPDSPNRPDFPNTILRPGETFRSETIQRFTVD